MIVIKELFFSSPMAISRFPIWFPTEISCSFCLEIRSRTDVDSPAKLSFGTFRSETRKDKPVIRVLTETVYSGMKYLLFWLFWL